MSTFDHIFSKRYFFVQVIYLEETLDVDKLDADKNTRKIQNETGVKRKLEAVAQEKTASERIKALYDKKEKKRTGESIKSNRTKKN